jgi:hypothetical protein
MVRRTSALIALLIVAIVAGATTSNAATVGTMPGPGYMVQAFGTYLSSGGISSVGPTAVSSLGCQPHPGDHSEHSDGARSRGTVVATGRTFTTGDALNVPGGTAARSTSNVTAVTLFSGRIQAAGVWAVSQTSLVNGRFQTSATGSRFSGLVVNGQAQRRSIDPNTRISLPGIGYAIFNEQIARSGADGASLNISMIHVVLTKRVGDLPSGAELIVGHAYSTMSRVAGPLHGYAYGTSGFFGGGAGQSSSSAYIGLACQGTDGRVDSVAISGAHYPGAFVVGAITDSAKGTVDSSSAQGEAVSRVQSINLAGGVVRASTAVADAHVLTNGTVVTVGDGGTGFLSLNVQGHPELIDAVPPNTSVNITGLGTLWLRREIRSLNSIEIRMIELIVTHANTQGIPVGSDVRIGVTRLAA